MNGILQEKTQWSLENTVSLGKKVGIINAQFFLTVGESYV